MIQFGAITMATISMFLKADAFSLLIPQGFLNGQTNPWSRRFFVYAEPRLDYGNDVRDLSFPGQMLFRDTLNEPMQPYEQFNDNIPSQEESADIPMMAKRSLEGLPVIGKRIHTCAFMRRLGLPIGLCFKGSRSRVSQQPADEPEDSPEQDAYAYLQRQWPVHSMLGGGVGK